MSIADYLDKEKNASVIFNPIPAYNGSWSFSIENLLKTSKKDGKINLFQQFYEKTFIKPLMDVFGMKSVAEIPIDFVSENNENNIGRCLKYSKLSFYEYLTGLLSQQIDTIGLNDEQMKEHVMSLLSNLKSDNVDLITAYASALKEKARRIKDVIDKEIQSDYFDAYMEDYNLYNPGISFSDFMKYDYERISKYQKGLPKLGDFFDRKINYEELYKCFDKDEFYLMFAKIIMDFNKKSVKERNQLDSSFYYLYDYNMAINEYVKDNNKYDVKIKYIDPENYRTYYYTRRDFQEEFKKMISEHPEFEVFELPIIDDDKNKYRDITLMEKLSQVFSKKTEVSWEFLPKEEKVEKILVENIDSLEVTSESREREKKDLQEQIANVNERIELMNNSGYIAVIKGVNTFNGYYAFVYGTGKVILEKFYKDENRKIPASDEATYVMSIDNFKEMSKKSKTTLIEYIRLLPNNGVKRLYHTSIKNFKRCLKDAINGTYRLEDAINFINGLDSMEEKR